MVLLYVIIALAALALLGLAIGELGAFLTREAAAGDALAPAASPAVPQANGKPLPA